VLAPKTFVSWNLTASRSVPGNARRSVKCSWT